MVVYIVQVPHPFSILQKTFHFSPPAQRRTRKQARTANERMLLENDFIGFDVFVLLLHAA